MYKERTMYVPPPLIDLFWIIFEIAFYWMNRASGFGTIKPL